MKKGLTILTLSAILFPFSANALTKNETVYTNLSSNGNPYNITVTNQILNNASKDIEDESTLKKIMNISGEEKFTQKDNKLTWKAKNKDIFYQGKTDKELPVDVNVKYYLNNEEINPKELAGKKGSIRIEYKFKNKEVNTVKGNTLYTPFVVTLGTILDSTKITNVNITNGKVINNGTKTMLVALASPGLYESVGYEGFKDFDKITVSFDTTSFKLKTVYIAATPKLLEDSDFDIFKKMNDVYSNIELLQKSMDQIEKGAKDLENGAYSLYNGSSEISKNLKLVSDSIEKLKEGEINVDNGLKQVVASLQTALGSEQEMQAKAANLTALKQANNGVITSTLTKSGKTLEELANIYNTNNLKEYTGDNADLLGVKSAYELIGLLSKNNEVIDSTLNLSTKMKDLMTALNKIEQGTSTLSSKMGELKEGVDKLYNGSNKLTEGTLKLFEGSKTLSQGTIKFNKEGIGKISGYANNIKNYTNKAEDLINLSREYNGFSSDNAKKTIFIYKVKGIKK